MPSVVAKMAAWPTGTCAAPKSLAVNLVTCPGPSSRRLSRAVCGSTVPSRHVRYCQRSRGALQATPCPTKRAGKVTAVCSQELSTETAQPTRSKTRTSVLPAGAWWRTWQLSSPSPFPERNRTSSKMLTGRNSSPSSCSFESRQRSTSRTAASLSKASTSVGGKPLKQARRDGQTCGATSGAKSMYGLAWATDSLCAR